MSTPTTVSGTNTIFYELLEIRKHLIERQLAFLREDAVQHDVVERGQRSVFITQVHTEESICRKLTLRQANKLLRQVETRVFDMVHSLLKNVIIEMCCAAAKVQQADSLTLR